MPDVKIFIACHKRVELPKYEYFYPVQAGAALAQEHFSDMLHDDTGNHISEKNDSYCELTVQYWAWKNQMADYYGFFHYRRFLSLEENQKSMYKVYYKADNAIVMENSGFKTDSAFSFIQNYDLLLPYGEKTAETVYQKYMHSKHHYKEDLDLIMALIAQHQPDYIMAMNQYLHGHIQYYYNMYIMKHEVFEQYCNWLFPLLEQFDKCNNREKYKADSAAKRVNGYLAERLFGIWFTYQKQNFNLRYKELPVLYFAMGNKKDYCKQWIKNAVFPAGSMQKRIVQSMKRN